ncbi:hypothetical protein QE152_g21859 [Popillia japonica]|uniref:GPR180-like N-terminal domain-containing protein n=1 Tax=Popillia japonica TaxID=7064 RepID=A0AAW1KM72_POPJA
MIHLFLIFVLLLKGACTKYLEGELKTSDNWAFLARFCFLSGDGQFEYYIEYNEERGQPNLLLYYDTLDQWPSVYKTSKTCKEKESVLKIEQNQIVNLTINGDNYRELAGCSVVPTQKTSTTTTSNAPNITRELAGCSVVPTQKTSTTTTSNAPNITKNSKNKIANATNVKKSMPTLLTNDTKTALELFSTEAEVSSTETIFTSTDIDMLVALAPFITLLKSLNLITLQVCLKTRMNQQRLMRKSGPNHRFVSERYQQKFRGNKMASEVGLLPATMPEHSGVLEKDGGSLL